ncbi:MAG: hypothetical protein ACXWP4_10710, partial [Polyangiales bacterium]
MHISRILLLSLIAGSTVAASCKGKFGFEGDPFVPDPPGPRPQYGPTISQAESPRPISGGTLLVVDANRAVVADPDRDLIAVVDLAAKTHTTITLSKGDDPGRAIADDKGRAHVVLRGAGEIATIDLASSSVTRTKVCTAPRGVAFDPGSAAIRVACADGKVMAVSTADLSVTLTTTGPTDLRDIAMVGEQIWVSRFRKADILVLDRSGNLLSTKTSPVTNMVGLAAAADASVAWRMIQRPGGVTMVHQRGRDPSAPPVKITAGGYTAESGQTGGAVVDDGTGGAPSTAPPPLRSRCKLGIVQSAVTDFQQFDSVNPTLPISTAVLPVDVAISNDGITRVVVAAGNAHTPELDTLMVLDGPEQFAEDCVIPQKKVPNPPGQPVAAAFDSGNQLVVQLREPAMLVVYEPGMGKITATIPYADGSREDTGHAIFHSNSGGFLACASCHPEGGDDGRVWSFEGVGIRRTQNLRGGVKAPFHWNGELADLAALTGEVLGKRMSGPDLASDQLAALSTFLGHVPSMPITPGLDAAAIARGKALFEGTRSQCATCHVGPTFTNSTIVDVGTGGTFKVPSLRGVAWRAPFMHTGCAATLADRFDPSCGGGTHGNVELTSDERKDMI